MPLAALVALAVVVSSSFAAEAISPEETLKRYLTAIQSQDFNKAFDLVSKGMKTDRRSGQVRSREVWVKESQYLVQLSEVKIFDFQIFPGKIEGDVAKVPNILSSQDKFLNQLGVEEHELYTLVKEGGAWKVDQQEMVIDAAGLARWFPKSGSKP
ncbi:MAG: hypothetical protein ACREQJ_09075 [Candidatus Binatia bacterium]